MHALILKISHDSPDPESSFSHSHLSPPTSTPLKRCEVHLRRRVQRRGLRSLHDSESVQRGMVEELSFCSLSSCDVLLEKITCCFVGKKGVVKNIVRVLIIVDFIILCPKMFLMWTQPPPTPQTYHLSDINASCDCSLGIRVHEKKWTSAQGASS